MKTKILLVLLLFTGMNAFSQNQGITTVGIKAGVLSSGVRGEAANSLNQLIDQTNGILKTTDRTGFFAGVNVNVPVSKNLSIEPGAYYSQKGYDLTGDFGIKDLGLLGVNAKADLLNQYIDLPLLLKGNFGGFEVFAGPQISYLAKSDLKTTAGILGINLLNKDIDASGQFNRWDAGLTGGIGYQFSNGFNISASYDYGLSKMDANKSVNAYNRAVRLGIGFQF